MTEVDVVGADGEKWTGSIAIGTTGIDESHISEETPAADVKESTPIMHNMDETDERDEEAVTLPGSTHSFLFTENVKSLPYMFGVTIAGMSLACLFLALINNTQDWSVPANVAIEVKIAQYLSIFIALLMEEEIPTGLYLLRRVSQPHLKILCPEVSYWRFVASCLLRISMGYMFLANVIVILILSEGVIDIFYDVLALQFIQQLDDIGFALSKMGVLGKSLQRSTMAPCFNAEFHKKKESMDLKWKYKIALKGVYFFNLFVFIAIMSVVTIRQKISYYQAESITVRFGDEVWDEALVDRGTYSEEIILLYSWFNGVYIKDKSRTNGGRPIYIEQKKSDSSPFDETGTIHPDYGQLTPVKPAEIKYCNGHWILTHDNITKSNDHDNECNWLVRSPKTPGFDLLEVSGSWQMWVGAIEQTEASITRNGCEDDDDCNLNGSCSSKGVCECDKDDEGVAYFGTHCQVKIKDGCRAIIDEGSGSEWSTDALPTWAPNDVFETYSRPSYFYTKRNLPDGQDPLGVPDKDDLALIYSGGRWFTIAMAQSRDEAYAEYWVWRSSNYHAFWSEALTPGVTRYVSDVTTKSTPVGTDFFEIGKPGQQFAPFGLELIPAQNVTGRGFFRCNNACIFCSDGFSVDDEFVVPDSGNATCAVLRNYLQAEQQGSYLCGQIQLAEQVCCPSNITV